MTTRNKDIMDTTDNRSVYNKSRKEYLERKGKIHCSWCAYHRGENDERKFYGSTIKWIGFISGGKVKKVRYPNWKLVSKNGKQWNKKPVIKIKKNFRFIEDYYELFF